MIPTVIIHQSRPKYVMFVTFYHRYLPASYYENELRVLVRRRPINGQIVWLSITRVVQVPDPKSTTKTTKLQNTTYDTYITMIIYDGYIIMLVYYIFGTYNITIRCHVIVRIEYMTLLKFVYIRVLIIIY